MPYYRAGDYYRGDYYRGNYAAGGLFGSIGKFLGGAVKKVAGAALSLTPVGRVAQALIPSLPGSKPQISQLAPQNIVPVPGFTGFTQRLLPGGESGFMLGGGGRRRMNVTNVKALRRAGRRVKGFLRLASRLGALPVNRGKGRTLFKKKRR